MTKQARIEFQPLFTETFERMLVKSPSIGAALQNFISFKSERPPLALPRGMRDHKLNPPLDRFSECHLSGNACLIYTDKNGVVTLIAVVDHDEMMGGKVKALAKKISHLKPSK